MAVAQIDPPLSAGTGYGLVVGLGGAFALIMSLISRALERHMGERQDSEFHLTAKRSVGRGLIASAVVSSWTLAATLLTSCSYGYTYGISGPYWYGAAATVQILIFSWVAIEFKRKAPNAHTFLEAVRIRYGTPGHIVLGTYAVVYQLLTSVNLLVGASSVYSAMTGMSAYACCVLFPLGVVIYTVFGGIKATFLTDYVHTLVILVIVHVSLFTVFAASELVGSPDALYALLRTAAREHPVSGNAGGEYLTMRSRGGIEAGMVIFVVGWAAIVDLQLFQKAIAADPVHTLQGYVLGGLSWFAIPFCLATTFGIVAVGLETNPRWPTYPNRMTDEEVAFGLPLPYAAQAVFGKGGAAAVMVMLFMAVTSAMSSEVVCACSLATYDVYKTYLNPSASDRTLLRLSHLTLILFASAVAGIAIAFLSAGVGVTFILTAAAVVVAPAVCPILATVTWRHQSALAVCVGPVLGSVLGVVAWMLAAWRLEGAITREAAAAVGPLLVGAHVALWSSLVVLVAISLCRPQRFDWKKFSEIQLVVAEGGDPDAEIRKEAMNDAVLKRSRWWALGGGIVLLLCYFVLWPLPMYGTSYVFSAHFFRGWVAVTFLWAFLSMFCVGVLPAYEGYPALVVFVKRVYGSWRGGVGAGNVHVVEGRGVEEEVCAGGERGGGGMVVIAGAKQRGRECEKEWEKEGREGGGCGGVD